MFDKIKGLIAAPLTPFNQMNRIDLNKIPEYASILKKKKVSGVFVNGTTGEGLSLSIEERKDLIKTWMDESSKDFKVISHVGHNSIRSSEEMIKYSERLGVYAIGSIGPIFFKPTNIRDLVYYINKLAVLAPDVPFYYYHIPSLTGLNFNMIDFLEEADNKIKNLAGIKFTFESLYDFELCRKFANGKYDIVFGRDEMLLSAYIMGANGAIGSTYNLIAPLYYEIFNNVDNNKLEQAVNLQRTSIQLINALIDSGAFIHGLKTILKSTGIDLGTVRVPLKPLSKEKEKNLLQKIEKLGISDYLAI